MRPDPTRSGPGLRAVVLSLLFVGALTLITSCSGGNDTYNTEPGTQATDVELSGIDVQVHHAVG